MAKKGQAKTDAIMAFKKNRFLFFLHLYFEFTRAMRLNQFQAVCYITKNMKLNQRVLYFWVTDLAETLEIDSCYHIIYQKPFLKF